MNHHHESLTHCPNCGAELHGAYCHDCGQKAALHLGVHDVVHEATHEFLHLDGKILNTVRLLLFRPGQLTLDFIAGRRVRYITPLRLYLTFSVLFFALTAIVPGARQSIIQVGSDEPAAVKKQAEDEAEKLGESILHNLPRAMFVLMPAFALLTWMLYRRNQRFYIPHLYYSVHFHAFTFLVLSLSMLAGLIGRPGKIIGGVMFLTTVPWHYFGLRRMFGNSWPKTILKGTAIGVLYWLMIAAVMVAITLWSIRHSSSNARETIDGSMERSRYSHTASASG
ncbi:MAG: DUF3667 domain-containing protein [Thermoanaerobaculia bacterium]